MEAINIIPDIIRVKINQIFPDTKTQRNYYNFADFVRDQQIQFGTYNIDGVYIDKIIRSFLQLQLRGNKIIMYPDGSHYVDKTKTEKKIITNYIQFTFASKNYLFDNLATGDITTLKSTLDMMLDGIVSYLIYSLTSTRFADPEKLEVIMESDVPFHDYIYQQVPMRLKQVFAQVPIEAENESLIVLTKEISNDMTNIINSFWDDYPIRQITKIIIKSDMTCLVYQVTNRLDTDFRSARQSLSITEQKLITPMSDFNLVRETVIANQNDLLDLMLLGVRELQLNEIIKDINDLKNGIQAAITNKQYEELAQLYSQLRDFSTSFNEIVKKIYSESHQNLSQLQQKIDYISNKIKETEIWLKQELYNNNI